MLVPDHVTNFLVILFGSSKDELLEDDVSCERVANNTSTEEIRDSWGVRGEEKWVYNFLIWCPCLTSRRRGLLLRWSCDNFYLIAIDNAVNNANEMS